MPQSVAPTTAEDDGGTDGAASDVTTGVVLLGSTRARAPEISLVKQELFNANRLNAGLLNTFDVRTNVETIRRILLRPRNVIDTLQVTPTAAPVQTLQAAPVTPAAPAQTLQVTPATPVQPQQAPTITGEEDDDQN